MKLKYRRTQLKSGFFLYQDEDFSKLAKTKLLFIVIKLNYVINYVGSAEVLDSGP
jgi:hypothetical protein